MDFMVKPVWENGKVIGVLKKVYGDDAQENQQLINGQHFLRKNKTMLKMKLITSGK